MAKKSVALIGMGQGPDVRIAGAAARVQVRGLQEGEAATILQKQETEEVELVVGENGVHELLGCDFASVNYEGSNRNFIACMLIGG